MKNMIQILEKDEAHVKLQIKDIKLFSPSVFSQMEADETCIRCVLMNQALGIISYQVQGYIPLRDVLSQYAFRKEEGMSFICELLKGIICANRNKPILLDSDFIYVSRYGDSFRFISLPLQLEDFYVSKEQCIDFLQSVLKDYRSQSHFEIPGYICCFLKSSEFSLPNLILGLQNVVQLKNEKKFFLFKKKVKNFRVEEPFHALYQTEEIQPVLDIEDNHTQLIGEVTKTNAYLLVNEEKIDLRAENILVGRSMACDIRLENESVSLKHAKLINQEDKWYIQDLKSTNGTYLDHKKVQRKMRVKDGMHIYFGKVDCEFHS